MPTRFPGFPKTTLKFLKDLKKNNTREWFNEHKPVYQSSVKDPMAELILALGDEVDKFAPGFVTDPKKTTAFERMQLSLFQCVFGRYLLALGA